MFLFLEKEEETTNEKGTDVKETRNGAETNIDDEKNSCPGDTNGYINGHGDSVNTDQNCIKNSQSKVEAMDQDIQQQKPSDDTDDQKANGEKEYKLEEQPANDSRNIEQFDTVMKNGNEDGEESSSGSEEEEEIIEESEEEIILSEDEDIDDANFS